MKDKLDEICTKYNLKLLGKVYIDPDVEAACRSLQIQGILRPGVQAETHFGGMRYYAGGSFSVEGTMTLTAPDTPWPYTAISIVIQLAAFCGVLLCECRHSLFQVRIVGADLN